MSQEVELNLTEQINNDEQEIYAALWISQNEQRIRRRTLVSSIPFNLSQSLFKWQYSFLTLVDPLIIDIDEKDEIPCNCWKAYEQLITDLNLWLNLDEGWQKISNWLEQYLNPLQEEIRVIIQTENSLLRLLPWQEWNLFTNSYPQVEIALSPSEYEPPEKWNGFHPQQKVKILVILGANARINLEKDRQLFNQIQAHGATLKFLHQPTLYEFRETLKVTSGWHILFFAGHSDILLDERGVLYLNNEGNYLTIDIIETELKIAIDNGLQLTILNSCKGLAIANQLAELRLPQCIVMREVVANQIAVDFLEIFLNAFSRNYSLFISVHKARNYLKIKYHHPEQYPGASSLPIIVSNPAVNLPKWRNFLLENQLPFHYRLTVYSGLVLIATILPLAVILDFHNWYRLVFYAQLYPHMLLFPVIGLWAFLWNIYKAVNQVINLKKIFLPSLICFAISVVVLLIEITSPNMLLFELNDRAISIIENIPNEKIELFQKIPDTIIQTEKIIRKNNIKIHKLTIEQAITSFIQLKRENTALTAQQERAYYKLMEFSLDYHQVWQGKKGWISYSRWAYAIIFFVVSFSLLILFILWIQSYDKENLWSQTKYIGYLAFAQLLIVLWIPFKSYYNLRIKNLIFGYTNSTGYFDTLVFIILLGLSWVTMLRLYQVTKNYYLAISSIIFVLLIFYLSAQEYQLIERLFGLNTISIASWILYPGLMMVFCYVWSKILEKWEG